MGEEEESELVMDVVNIHLLFGKLIVLGEISKALETFPFNGAKHYY